MAEFINMALGFVAQQNFICNGVKYTTGDVFDIEGLSERQLERLWRYRRIRNADLDGELSESPKIEVSAPDPGPAQQFESEPEPPRVNEPASEVAQGVEFEDTGAGWYNVKVGGYTVSDKKLRGLDAAQDWAKENGFI